MPIVARLLKSLIKYLQKKKNKRRKNRKGKPPRPSKSGPKHRNRKDSRKRRIIKPLKRVAAQRPGFQKPRKKGRTKKIKKIRRLAAKKANNLGMGAGSRHARAHEACIGEITHFFTRIQVVVLKITAGKLTVGESVRIKGKSTNFVQRVQSMQIESIDVTSAHKGQLVGLKVSKKARPGDKVYTIK